MTGARAELLIDAATAATDLDLISFLKAIPDTRMRRGIRIPAWNMLQVTVFGILSKCESLRDPGRFARRQHAVLTERFGIQLKCPPTDSAFGYFFLQVDVASICAAIREWTLTQIPSGASDLYQLISDGKTLWSSIEATVGGGSASIAQVRIIQQRWAWRSRKADTRQTGETSTRSSRSSSAKWDLRVC